MTLQLSPYRYRRQMPTPRPWPTWTLDRADTRQAIYHRVRTEPRTAADIAGDTGLPILDAVDELRILEGFEVIRHRADDLGVIRWHHRPGNPWDQKDPPF
jgi:hypothetical protein